MLRLVAPLIALLFSTSAYCAKFEIPDYSADRITDRVYVIHGPLGMPSPENQGFMNNPVIAIGDEGVVIVDPGSSLYTGRMVLRQVAKLTDNPVTHVIGTHIHGDHWLGNHAIRAAYPEAQFMAHPIMIEMANQGEANVWLKLVHDLTRGASEGTEAVIPDQPLEDGQVLTLPGLTISIMLSEHAHTKTDAMVLFQEDKVVVIGDNALYGRIGRMDDGQFKGNIAALERALDSGAEKFVPGHGQTAGREAAGDYRDYLSTIYKAAVAGADEMMAPFEIKEQIIGDFTRFQSWPGFNEEFGRHVSLAVLEAEQDAF